MDWNETFRAKLTNLTSYIYGKLTDAVGQRFIPRVVLGTV